jgi:hypothetical protein
MTRPSDTEPFAGPEHAEGGQHHADAELEGVFRHARQRAVDDRARGKNEHARSERAEDRR